MANVNRQAYLAQGLCGCGRKPRPGLRSCKRCASKQKEYLATHPRSAKAIASKVAARKLTRQSQRDAGLCNSCPAKACPGKRACPKCAARQRQKIAEMRADPEYMARTRRWNNAARRRLRREVFDAYGGPVCLCCGEEHFEFLTIDHIEKPSEESKVFGYRSGTGFYQWLRNQGFPEGYRVLCLNCNFAIGHYGYCPHEFEQVSPVRSPKV